MLSTEIRKHTFVTLMIKRVEGVCNVVFECSRLRMCVRVCVRFSNHAFGRKKSITAIPQLSGVLLNAVIVIVTIYLMVIN